ncbi:putative transcriptional regulator [Desulfitobacterium dehalogenans ATCC 51507]|uniref:Putative transcriptional regulator n=1 Tax=Desulfitobacterium dehalogenans (strain ATCC 51507 / DSM 9161 / JW/IU-DC1) TaxID=756499 RepID=I4A7U1_DESDJ|nr:PadR family transcriptional regulator [Desulfitobacterium dehalogenans]AFM00026.1 putative transcriptional regulator [Desulfitobacterium dehalogenans ATCC 51507]
MIPSQMLKGMLEGCILEVIRKKETYAYEISEQLEKYEFGTISEGTIYPIILRLQKSEMIEATLRDSKSGPPRKYYHLTEKGVAALAQFKENWQELESAINQLFMEVEEVEEGHEGIIEEK